MLTSSGDMLMSQYTQHKLNLISHDSISGEASEHRMSTPFESRRKQAMAIVMLGVLGAEFGQEMEPSKRKAPEDSKKRVVDGFGLSNYSHARHTSESLYDNTPKMEAPHYLRWRLPII